MIEFDGDSASGVQHYVFIDQVSHDMRLAWTTTPTCARVVDGTSSAGRRPSMRRNGQFDRGQRGRPCTPWSRGPPRRADSTPLVEHALQIGAERPRRTTPSPSGSRRRARTDRLVQCVVEKPLRLAELIGRQLGDPRTEGERLLDRSPAAGPPGWLRRAQRRLVRRAGHRGGCKSFARSRPVSSGQVIAPPSPATRPSAT